MRQVIRMSQTEALDIIANSFNVDGDKVKLNIDTDYLKSGNNEITPYVKRVNIEIEVPLIDKR